MIVALLLMVAMPMMAERVSPETARKVAQTFLNNNGAKSTQLIDLSKAAGFANLYIFNGEEGFVVMAADDCVKPILGYSLTGKFVAEGMPENVRGWLQGYSDEIQYAVDRRMRATAENAKAWKDVIEGNAKAGKATVAVEAMVQTAWNQNGYYYNGNYVVLFNNLCPIVTENIYNNGGHAYTGCVATAMAQIIRYWNLQQPTVIGTGIGMHSYIHSTYGEQSADFRATSYDWNNMTNTCSHNSTETEKTAVATLMYHCGVAVNMNYGPTGSGAFSTDIPSALINYFNFSTSANYKERYESSEEWKKDLRSELDAGRPMEYSGSGPRGGHSFICDGYSITDNTDYFHFNWGWGGLDNGLFTIDDLTPGSHNYNSSQSAVFGIKPALCATSAPSNFTATLTEATRNVTLSWTAVTTATAYEVFRDGTSIGTVQANESLSFTDNRVSYGTHIYYLRSVDSEGEMSLPSEYKTIAINFTAPSQLVAELTSEGHVNLTWEAAPNANSYNIYCNEVRIAQNVTNTSFEDPHPIPTSPSYYVKGADAFGDESEASNTVTVNVPYSTPNVDDLRASLSNGNATLSWSAPNWCYPQNATHELNYGSGNPYYYWGVKYYAHRYVAENLSQYAGLSIYKVSTQIAAVGTYTLYVYTNSVNDKPDPNALDNTTILTCTNGGWRDIPLSQPIAITGETDLWIVLKQENTNSSAPIPSFNLSEYNQNACYLSSSSPTNLSPTSNSISWFIKTYLTDGTYTYNLYDGTTTVASNINATNYTVSNVTDNAAHQYTVKTNYYGGESAASNMAGLTLGTASLSNLQMASSDQMTITEGSKLTVSGTLTNTDPANLILENGAELVHNSANVKATVKKTITPPSVNDHGWYFIASPVTETVTPTADNGFLNGAYDLYYYNEPTHYWMNYESSAFSLMPQKGYLYANEDGTTLQFTGTLTPSNSSVTINDLSHSASSLNGFNLVGNPFACNATVGEDFYVVDNETNKVILASNGSEIAPCAGIFVKATANDASVTFTKAASRVEPSSSSFDIVVKREAQPTRDGVATGSTTLDRARVRLGDAETLEKFSFGDDEGSNIYFPQDGQDLAVACANGQNELPVNFKAAENGTYTLAFEVENLDLDYLHLIDNMTGDEVDVLAMPAYTFEAKTSDYASRFKLVFSEPTDGPSADDQPFAYYANDEIRIVADACDASLQVVDVTGRVVVSVGGHTRCVPTAGMAPGVYVLRLINGDNVRTQKIVIE